jgi:hypothetical protein
VRAVVGGGLATTVVATLVDLGFGGDGFGGGGIRCRG